MELQDLCQVKDTLATIVQLESRIKRESGLSLNQAFALCCLSKGDLNPTELAARLRIPVPSLSRMLRALVGRGLVERNHDNFDARQTMLKLTPAGQELAQHLHECETRLFPAVVVSHPLEKTSL